MLIAPLTPPARRFLIFSKLDESIEIENSEYPLYTNVCKNYISEGYLVYNINLDEGIKLKGVITHNEANNNSAYKTSQLLRGVYIKDNLITISQHMLKVNNLNTLEEVSSIGI